VSLKAFHIFFISLSSLLSFGVAAWTIFLKNDALLGIVFIILAFFLIVYGVLFLVKQKNVSFL
jgi:hypothetical protein